MRNSYKKGNHLVEYAVVFALVGVAIGIGLWNVNPDIYKNFFKYSISKDVQENDGVVNVKPMGETSGTLAGNPDGGGGYVPAGGGVNIPADFGDGGIVTPATQENVNFE